MSENTNVVGNSFLDGRSNAGRFDLTSIALHWLTTVLVGAQFATTWLLSRPGANVEALLTAHRSTGMFVWAVVIARIAWRSYFAELPPFPASMPKLQQWAAKLNEYGLYVPLLLQPLTGNTGVLFRGRPFVLFAWEMPALLTPNKTIYEVLELGPRTRCCGSSRAHWASCGGGSIPWRGPAGRGSPKNAAMDGAVSREPLRHLSRVDDDPAN